MNRTRDDGLNTYIVEVKRLMAEHGYTQTRLAHASDVPVGQINSFLNGRQRFKIGKINQLLAVFGQRLHVASADWQRLHVASADWQRIEGAVTDDSHDRNA
ncbi:MAG TPA: XRE family transcriptional regulator [Phycisphaerae bacterium]|nr:XRE family transcriptional regulator [Phycisphaerae bacterium]